MSKVNIDYLLFYIDFKLKYRKYTWNKKVFFFSENRKIIQYPKRLVFKCIFYWHITAIWRAIKAPRAFYIKSAKISHCKMQIMIAYLKSLQFRYNLHFRTGDARACV